MTGTSGTTHDGTHTATGTTGTGAGVGSTHSGTTGPSTTGSSGFSQDAKLAGAKLDDAIHKGSDGTYSK